MLDALVDALVDGLGRLGRLGSAPKVILEISILTPEVTKDYPFADDKYFNTRGHKVYPFAHHKYFNMLRINR